MSDAKPPAATAPAAVAVPRGDAYVAQTITFLDGVFGQHPAPDFSFRLWEGTQWQPLNAKSARFTIVLNHAAALRRMFLPPTDARLAEAYVLGDFDIEGDGERALSLGEHLWKTWSWRDTLSNAVSLVLLPRCATPGVSTPRLSGVLHSPSRDRDAIQIHYDVSNEFYAMWLDKRMVYSCAYFKSVDDDIDSAQVQKLDYICRKLRLKSGERLLDIGCGWGALIIHAATHYGVHSTGVTLSERQAELARLRIEKAGLSDTCVVKLCDYRDLDDSQPFDKLVSVGMVEHVGRNNLQPYFEKAYRLLKPGGVFLNHGITLLYDIFKSQREIRRGFFGQYIFPDGDLQPLPYILARAAAAHWEIRDVECLREHYAMTLRCWRKAFERRREEIERAHGPQMYRLWWLYLLAAGWGFETGLHALHQTLLYKPSAGSVSEDLPLRRSDWYADS